PPVEPTQRLSLYQCFTGRRNRIQKTQLLSLSCIGPSAGSPRGVAPLLRKLSFYHCFGSALPRALPCGLARLLRKLSFYHCFGSPLPSAPPARPRRFSEDSAFVTILDRGSRGSLMRPRPASPKTQL